VKRREEETDQRQKTLSPLAFGSLPKSNFISTPRPQSAVPNQWPRMPRALKGKSKQKSKQYRAPCGCGCGSTSPATIAAHGKVVTRKANINSLAIARSIARLTGSSTSRLVPTKHHSRRTANHFDPPVEDHVAGDHADEDAMDTDLLQASGCSNPSPPLTHVWASRASRREREDEDLVSEPGSPELSEEESEAGNERDPHPNEPEFLSDDEEPQVHAEISATEQLTAGFQVRATIAGMSCSTVISHCGN
jgi:hypothetical protein